MKVIKEYKVIEARSMQDLTDKVNEAIKNGWRPQGGITEVGHSNYLFYQAMVYEA
ncbi:DUF1737 domain-containing protein [Chryseobacterium balustinum]|uniref:DUF1737 domain-containing protein n=1 Tax=Chryseobacterium balustinum TaxID=246 RepID=UPI003CE7A96B